jgi:tetratricopeptide (TPR) repeat protein
MKAIKYLFLGALLIGSGTSVMAQDGTKADVDAMKSLVKNKPADFDKQVKNYIKANKKNAENLVAIGRVLYEADDTLNARAFAEQALTATKRGCAPAYILLGDIQAKADDGGAAAQNYEQAILVDPKDPAPYRRYATVYRKISPEGAVQKLEELRQARPDYPVDALIGHINYISLRYGKANEAFARVPLADLSRMDYIEYAMSNYHGRQYDKALEIVKAGLAKEELNATLNRIAMMCSNELKQYPEALKYAETLFNKVDKDSVTLSDIDFQNYGKALDGTEQYEAAIAKYKEALALPEVEATMKSDLYKSISDSYKDLKNFPEAINFYKQFLETKAESDATDHAGLALLTASYARTLEGEDKIAMLKQADDAYSELVNKFADAEEYALWQRGRLNAQMDADMSQALANPHFIRLAELINAHETIDDTDKARLFDAYAYLMRYHLKQKDNKAAYEYALKLQELQPDDPDVQSAVEALAKVAK